jgi:peptidyl-prolyl cis-trans isomerase C
MMSALALCWALTGCGRSKPAEQAKAETPAAPAEVAAPAVAEPAAPATEAEPAAVAAEDAAVVVAKVNDKDITEGEIQKVMGMFMKQMGGRIPPDQVESAIPRIRERIVEELIMRNVMLAEVAKQGISLSDSEFEEVKAELAKELPAGTTFESYMAETGTTEAEMREQMAVRKMIMAKADDLAKPTDEEIQKFYDENKEGFAEKESVTASHILIKVDPADDAAAKTAKRERIDGLRKQLVDGADFAEVAKANSDCPSASAGGDLGSFGRGQMVPEFEDAAFKQPVGSVGEVIETQFGYHIIKVAEHNEGKAQEFAEVKVRISDILYSQKQQDAVREYVDGLRTGANIQRFDKAPEAEMPLQMDVEGSAPEAAEAVEIGEESAPAMEEPEAVAAEVVSETVESVSEAPAAGAEEVKEVAAEATAAVESAVEELVPAEAVEVAPVAEEAPAPAPVP